MSLAAGIAVLLLSCIGNAELWVVLMNRRHALRYRHHRLKRARYFHDAGVLLYPPFLLIYAGLGKNGLLRGGSVGDLSVSLQGTIAVTLVGLIPFFFSVVRWTLRQPPKRQLGCSSTVHNVLRLASTDAEVLHVKGEDPPLLARFPLNQIYQLEVSRKRLRIDRKVDVPTASVEDKVIRVAHFSDVHLIGCPGKGFHDFVTDELCKLQPDAFFFTGDLLDRQDLAVWAVEFFSRMAAIAPGYFILGNHDWHLDYSRIRRQLVGTGWQDLGEKSLTADIGGCSTLLAGTEAPWIGVNPEVPLPGSEQLRLLLSHAPDQRNYAFENRFDLMLCGHNHGGQVVLPVVGPVYSPSIYGVRYAGGVFEHGDLLMHVSKGVGGKDALRWNCRPEVTLLELEVVG